MKKQSLKEIQEEIEQQANAMNDVLKEEHQQRTRRPSCLLELGLMALVGGVALVSALTMLGQIAGDAFNSLFGMGLK